MNPWNYIVPCFALALGATAVQLWAAWRAVRKAERLLADEGDRA